MRALDRYDKLAHKDKGAFGSTFIVAGTAQKTSDLGGLANARLDLFGPALADFMKRAKRGLTRVAGPGIFPTEGAPNPTYSIFALSLRGAEHFAASWSSVAGNAKAA